MKNAMNSPSTPETSSSRSWISRALNRGSAQSSVRETHARCVVEVTSGGGRAIDAEILNGAVVVHRAWEVAPPSDSVDAMSAERGVVDALRNEGALHSGALLSLSRLDAMLRTIDLPTDDVDELSDMARLAVLRDLPVEGASGVTDYVVLESTHGASKIVGAALSLARFESLCAVLSSVSTPAGAVSVRTLGTLALFRTLKDSAQSCVFVVDCVADRVEFLLIDQGAPTFSRAAEIGLNAEQRSSRILMEARRALLALRRASVAPVITQVYVLAESALALELIPQLAAAAGCSAKRLETHPLLRMPAGAAGDTVRASCLPLAGLLLARLSARRVVDLLHPAQPIDRAARMRRRVIGVAAMAALAAVFGWSAGSFELNALQSHAEKLREQATIALPELQRAKREEFRVKHINLWLASDPAWMDYLVALRGFAPDSKLVVLDGMSGLLAPGEIEFARDRWEVTGRELKFTLDGEAKDRATADALRDALVNAKSFGVTSTGADARGGRRLPYPFAYVVRTSEARPAKAAPPTAPAPSATKGGAL